MQLVKFEKNEVVDSLVPTGSGEIPQDQDPNEESCPKSWKRCGTRPDGKRFR